jgi:hypothetical protein
MALRISLGCLVAALVVCVAACKGDKGNTAKLEARCEQLAKACGENDKKAQKIADGCKPLAQKQAEKGCTDQTIAAYDCLQKELCGKGDKVWAVEDLHVLAERQNKCVAERKAVHDCLGE